MQNENTSSMKYNMEKVLMNVVVSQKALFEKIQSKYEAKSLIEETDF